MKYGLPDQAVNQICSVVAQYPQVERAVLYGSRAKGNFKPGSDIDLTLLGACLTQRLCNSIAEALDDLLLPYSIDLSVFAELHHPELEAHIQRVGVVFFERDGRDL
jgi:predicted nucleotidyltransferase